MDRFEFPTPAKLRIVLRGGGEILVDGLRWTAGAQEPERVELLDADGNTIMWQAIDFTVGEGNVLDFSDVRPTFAPS